MLLGRNERSKRRIIIDRIEIGKIRKRNMSFQDQKANIKPTSEQKYVGNKGKPGITQRKKKKPWKVNRIY